jgi:F0F1-type ATP synthase membrane subunit b/b'
MNIIEDILSNISIGETIVSLKSFGFNSNILEANVFNIAILVTGVVYLGRNFLTSILSLRQQQIIESINEAEERLQQAHLRLIESEKQMTHSKLLMEQIIKEAEITAEKVAENTQALGRLDIVKLTNSGRSTIEKAELQVKKQIQVQITNLMIKKVSSQLKEIMNSTNQSKLIDLNISQLRGQI